jgi:hypothetical protein
MEQLIMVDELTRAIMAAGPIEIAAVQRQELESTPAPEGTAPGRGVSFGTPRAGTPAGARGGRSLDLYRDRDQRPAGQPSGKRDRGKAPVAAGPAAAIEEKLAEKLHFEFDLVAREAMLFDLLNRLATNQMFIVTTAVTVEKQAADVLDLRPSRADEKEPGDVAGLSRGTEDEETPLAVAAETAREAAKELTRGQRLVSGPDMEIPVRVRLGVDVYRFKGEESRGGQ